MELIDIGYEYYRFGSVDSIDIDILINHPNSTGLENDSQLLKIIKEQNSKVKEWNANIIAIENGVVTKSIPSKGAPDGVNNCLYDTYKFHLQKFNFPLKQKLERNRSVAIEKFLSSIFTFYKESIQNEFYKSIPKNVKNASIPLSERIEYLSKFDFNLKPFESDRDNIEAYKRIAFHLGQTISLLDGVEIYTKQDLIKYHIQLKKIIDRELIDSYNILNEKLNDLINKIK